MRAGKIDAFFAVGGVPIDLRTIDVPTYMVSCREDHIAPWVSTFAATKLFRGPVRFVLSVAPASGLPPR